MKPLVILSLVLLAACQAEPKAELPQKQDAPVAPAVAVTPDSAIQDLNRMDTRTPVPLQPMMAWHQKQNMQDHLVAIQEIVSAAAAQDWERIIKASARIESSPQMAQMCQHMGAGAPGFTDMALDFHSRADAIGVAAKAKDIQTVLEATSYTLEACTACHAQYRQDVVDAATWTSLTGSTHVPMQH